MKLTRQKKEIRLVVGGESRVELLPPEVAMRGKAQSTRRALVGVVVLAGLVVAGGYGVAVVVAEESTSRLAAEQEQTAALISQQGEFVEVRTVKEKVRAAKAALEIGASTEIAWQPYVAEVRAAMTGDLFLSGFDIETGTPTQALAQAVAPLQGSRVATIVLSATSSNVPNAETWLRNLEKTTGFVDGVPGSITFDDTSQSYTVSITVHISSEALTHRFAQEVGAAGTEEG